MVLTMNRLKQTDKELIEMMIESFYTEDKMADVVSRFAAKHQKTENSVRTRWNKVRPFYIEIARERGLDDIVEDAKRRSEIAIKNAESRKKNKIASSVPGNTKKTSIKKQELFDRFNKTDSILDKVEQIQQETLQHIQISHKTNDARFNGISSMLKLIAEKVEHPKQNSQQVNGMIEMNKFGQVQSIEMNNENQLDQDKVLKLIDDYERLENELKDEMDLRKTGEDLYGELKNEFNSIKNQLDDTKDKLQHQLDANFKLTANNSELQRQLDKALEENTKLVNINKLLNKRGLIDRLLNRDIEYNTAIN